MRWGCSVYAYPAKPCGDGLETVCACWEQDVKDDKLCACCETVSYVICKGFWTPGKGNEDEAENDIHYSSLFDVRRHHKVKLTTRIGHRALIGPICCIMKRIYPTVPRRLFPRTTPTHRDVDSLHSFVLIVCYITPSTFIRCA